MNQIYYNQLIIGEMFEATIIENNNVIFKHSSGKIEGCFGKLTHNVDFRNRMMQKTIVNLFFNHDSDLLTKKDHLNHILNYTVFETESLCKREFSYIYKHVRPYVDFKYTVHLNECNKMFRNIYDGKQYNVNSNISLEFKNCYMYEIFLVLQMYRRFLQLHSKRVYWLSKELTQKKWHNLSFVNNALFCDSFSKVPYDQKILFNGIFPKYSSTQFISKTTFRNNKEYFKNYTYMSLSSLCVINLKQLKQLKQYDNYSFDRLSSIPLSSFSQYFFGNIFFKYKNLVKRNNVNYKILETTYNRITNKYFKRIKKILKCTK